MVEFDGQTSAAHSIAAQLRASIRKARVPRRRGAAGDLEWPDPLDSLDQRAEHDLTLLRANYDIAHAPFTTHRPLTGRFIIALKNLARELLMQLLERQTSYNRATVRVLDRLSRKLDLIAQEQQRIAQRLERLESIAGAATRETSQAGEGINAAGDADRTPGRAPQDRA